MNKGFILSDALINVLIVSSLCLLTMSIYRGVNNFDEGFIKYQERINEKYELLHNSLAECKRCLIEEEVFPLEP
ncbi:MAG: hypothetical protein Q4B60_03135 [Erysipelotrichaceae bacterium]|nr:hypothetical protein [Erysipelotrichaceae bacterium]